MNKALFLDRDGIINVDYMYTYEINKFKPVDSIIDLIKTAKKEQYLVICITNQSGIAKMKFTFNQYIMFMNRLNSYLYNHCGFTLDDTYVCPHDPKLNQKPYGIECNCRKPKPGLFARAIHDYDIDVRNSIMIGDKLRDVEAAYHANVQTRILLTSGIDDKTINSKFFTHKFQSLKEVIPLI